MSDKIPDQDWTKGYDKFVRNTLDESKLMTDYDAQYEIEDRAIPSVKINSLEGTKLTFVESGVTPTSSPETDAEDGWIDVVVDGVTFQVPYYS